MKKFFEAYKTIRLSLEKVSSVLVESFGLQKRLKHSKINPREYLKKLEAVKVAEALKDYQQKINHWTGYESIETLKKQVLTLEAHYSKLQHSLQSEKSQYMHLIQQRSQLQRDLNHLLQRKHTWQPEDVQLFTESYKKEHDLDKQEQVMREHVQLLERQVEEAHQNLMHSIRERYQQEQIWSDSIRSLSNYGTFGLILLNFMLFVLVHSYIEPKRRRNLIEQLQTAIEQNHSKEVLEFLKSNELNSEKSNDSNVLLKNDLKEELSKETAKIIERLEKDFEKLQTNQTNSTSAILNERAIQLLKRMDQKLSSYRNQPNEAAVTKSDFSKEPPIYSFLWSKDYWKYLENMEHVSAVAWISVWGLLGATASFLINS